MSNSRSITEPSDLPPIDEQDADLDSDGMRLAQRMGKDGGVYGNLPKKHRQKLGIEKGTALEPKLFRGHRPIILREPAIIIRPAHQRGDQS